MKSELYLKNISLLGHSQSGRPFKLFGKSLRRTLSVTAHPAHPFCNPETTGRNIIFSETSPQFHIISISYLLMFKKQLDMKLYHFWTYEP